MMFSPLSRPGNSDDNSLSFLAPPPLHLALELEVEKLLLPDVARGEKRIN